MPGFTGESGIVSRGSGCSRTGSKSVDQPKSVSVARRDYLTAGAVTEGAQVRHLDIGGLSHTCGASVVWGSVETRGSSLVGSVLEKLFRKSGAGQSFRPVASGGSCVTGPYLLLFRIVRASCSKPVVL